MHLGVCAAAQVKPSGPTPLVVPHAWYVREGLSWQLQQPVCITVDVDGKRDLNKYAAVMQRHPKVWARGTIRRA